MAMAMDTALQRTRRKPVAARPIVIRRLGIAATAVATLAACFVSTGVTAGNIWGRRSPDIALRFWFSGSEAMAQRAAELMSERPNDAAVRADADRLARDALARDTTNVTAMRNRGLIADLNGNSNAARRWMRSAEAFSRRDPPTQLWLIEDAVARGDIGQALTHYDRALRTSKNAPELLFPVLIAASNDASVADELSKRLAGRPNWWGPFVNRLIGETDNPAILVLFARRLGLSPNDREHPDFFGRILQRLVDANQVGRADALYRTIVSKGSQPLYNGDFEQDRGVLPFDWRLADESDLAAQISARPDGAKGQVLMLDARNGRGGEVAAQAVALKPGHYVLQGVAAHVSEDESARPVARIRCGPSREAELAALRLPRAAAAPVAFALPFTLPARCSGAWIVIEANSDLGGHSDRPWLDNLRIVRMAPGSATTAR